MEKPRVLILPCPTTGGTLGTVGYILSIAEELRDVAEILVHAPGYCAEFMERYGFATSVAPAPVAQETNASSIDDLIDAMLWMGLLDQSYITTAVDAEIQVIKSYRPHVVLSDFNLTAPLSTSFLGVPLVSLAAEPTYPTFQYKEQRYGYMANRFDDVCSELDLRRVEDVRELCYLRSTASIATSWPEFEPNISDVPGIQYVGALVHVSKYHDSNIRWETDKKKVFSYLSVSAIPPSTYIPILKQAYPGSEFEVICSIGAGFKVDDFLSIAGHIRLINWAPMDELFPDADLVIYHGGQGTGMAAALHEVPSIAVPGRNYERLFNAVAFERMNIACNMKTTDFRAHILRKKFYELQSALTKSSLQSVSSILRDLGGAKRAAEIVLEHAMISGGMFK